MSQIIAAVKSGTDPLAALPKATFHRTLEECIYCPKCEATYSLIVDYDWAVSHYFADESRRHIAQLKKAVTMGHLAGHRVTHFESNGVIVTRHIPPEPKPMLPMPKLVM